MIFLAALTVVAPIARAQSLIFDEAVAWPEKSFHDGESRELMAETRARLRFFAYDVGDGRTGNLEADEFHLRSAIRTAQMRLGLPPTGRASEQLITTLKQAQEGGDFPCPSTQIEHAANSDAQTEYKFRFLGRRPLLYAMQALTRFNACAPKAFPVRVAFADEEAASIAALTSPRTKLPVRDETAEHIFDLLMAQVAARSSEDNPARIDVALAVRGPYELTVPLSEASFPKGAPFVPAKKPAIGVLRSVCLDLGYAPDCVRADDVELWAPKDASLNYWVEIDHFLIEATLALPTENAVQFAEDISQHVTWINKTSNSVYVSKPYYFESARGGRSLEAEYDNAANSQTGECASGANSAEKALAMAKCMEEKLGFPASGRGSAIVSDDNGGPNIVLIDGASMGKFTEHALNLITPEGGYDPQNAELLRPAGLKHSYFHNISTLDFDQQEEKAPPPEPGHSIFALGLIKGAAKTLENGLEVGGYAATSHSAIVRKQDFFDETFLSPGGWRDSAQQYVSSGIKPKRAPDITVVIEDENFCLQGSDNRQFADKRSDLENRFKKPTKGLIVLAAPYRQTKSQQASGDCGEPPEDNGDQWSCRPGNGVHGRIPLACIGADQSSQVIIAASANKNLDGMLNAHFRPKTGNERSKKMSERFLAAPGCDLVSADVGGNQGAATPVARRRACGSSYAAPIVAAAASRLIATAWFNDKPTIDVKTHLIATSNPAVDDDDDDLFGVLNWVRAAKTNPNKVTVWYKGFPDGLIDAEEKTLNELCMRFSSSGKHINFRRNRNGDDDGYTRCQADTLKIYGTRKNDYGKSEYDGDLDEYSAATRRWTVAIRKKKTVNENGIKHDRILFNSSDDENPHGIGIEKHNSIFSWSGGCRNEEGDSDRIYAGKQSEPSCIQLCNNNGDSMACIMVPPADFTHIIFPSSYAKRQRQPGKSNLSEAFGWGE